jgi:hypothetical protein
MKYKEDKFQMILRQFRTEERKSLIRIIRILIECAMNKKIQVKIILSNEVDYLMFEFLAEVLIKVIVYHKNENMKVESCQFRNGKCYFIKINANNLFKSNRSMTIWNREIHIAREFGLNCQELVETFNVVFNIPMKIRDNVIRNAFMMKEFWLLDSSYEFVLKFSRAVKFEIKRGVNRIEVKENLLKGGNLIPIKILIYGTELILMIPPNTSVVFIYNVVATWMGQEPSRIRIQVCKVGKLVEGMGHFLTSNDFLWDGIYNFDFYEARISKKQSDMPNHGLNLEENVGIVVDLKTAVIQYKVNRFLKLSSIKKIIKNRLLNDYNKSPIFEDEVALPYSDDMKVEMFCGSPMQGYLLEQRHLFIEVNYVGGSFQVPVRNYKIIKGFQKKMCMMYSLGKDVVITDEENRSYNQNIIFEYCPEEVWIC